MRKIAPYRIWEVTYPTCDLSHFSIYDVSVGLRYSMAINTPWYRFGSIQDVVQHR